MNSRHHDTLTIVAIYGHNDGSTAIPALTHSMRELPGAKGLLISIAKPPALPSDIAWRPVLPMDHRQYSLFVMYCLTHFILTDFALIVQDDGWVVNGHNWRDEYLDYDYVGAPGHAAIVDNLLVQRYEWVGMENPMVIQNGGFSLRSRKYLLAPGLNGLMYHFQEQIPLPYEDVQLAGLFRPQLEALGIRFAPDDIAKTFSVEYFGPGYHDDTRLDAIFGLHARTRKLHDNKIIKYSASYDEAAEVYREVEFMDYLETIGYTVQYPD